MFKDNLVQMRKMKQMTQEDVRARLFRIWKNADALRNCSEFPWMI